MKKYIDVAKKAAKIAGKILKDNYGTHLKFEYKKGMDIVTEVDLKSEKKIKAMIRKNFPSHSVYGEESGLDKRESDLTWIIDPLDGTTNYTMMNPFFNVAIALARKDEVIMGVVYNPLSNELFYASKGKGSFLNGKRIRVNRKKNLQKSIVLFCHGSSKKAHTKRATKFYSKMKLEANHTRQLGSAALELSYVACGRSSAFYMNNMNAYDIAAGAAIVKEAGGKVTDFSGKRFTLKSKDILASNGFIHKKMVGILR